MTDKISIIGGGSWGTAIAQLLARNGHRVMVYVRNENIRNSINNNHINNHYFPDFKLSTGIFASSSLKETVFFSNIIVLSVPTQVTRLMIKKLKPYLSKKDIIVSTAKGIEEDTFLSNAEIIKELCPNPVAVLSGPTHSEEVIKGLPSAAAIAASDRGISNKLQSLFMTSDFRVYVNNDIKGIELAGAIKNIIALASGIADGIGFGDNTKAALITRGLREMSRFGKKLGGTPLTFSGLAGLGDLVVTCTSMYSRNRRFGIKIGEGQSYQDALDAIGQVVEGARTTAAIYNWIQEQNIDVELPITEQVYRVLFENKSPTEAVEDLMLRGPKQEIEKK